MRRSDLLRGRTVLVIEDDDDTREVVSRLVEALGATTVVAADGLEGLVQLERRRPDAVLCDLAMPIMNGIEFARRMRQNPRYWGMLLIAVTGRERDADFMATLDATSGACWVGFIGGCAAGRMSGNPSGPPAPCGALGGLRSAQRRPGAGVEVGGGRSPSSTRRGKLTRWSGETSGTVAGEWSSPGPVVRGLNGPNGTRYPGSS
jgi:CheY-like chemotaxis protein